MAFKTPYSNYQNFNASISTKSTLDTEISLTNFREVKRGTFANQFIGERAKMNSGLVAFSSRESNNSGKIWIYNLQGDLLHEIVGTGVTTSSQFGWGFDDPFDLTDNKLIVCATGLDKVFLYDLSGTATEQIIDTPSSDRYSPYTITSNNFGNNCAIGNGVFAISDLFATVDGNTHGVVFLYNYLYQPTDSDYTLIKTIIPPSAHLATTQNFGTGLTISENKIFIKFRAKATQNYAYKNYLGIYDLNGEYITSIEQPDVVDFLGNSTNGYGQFFIGNGIVVVKDSNNPTWYLYDYNGNLIKTLSNNLGSEDNTGNATFAIGNGIILKRVEGAGQYYYQFFDFNGNFINEINVSTAATNLGLPTPSGPDFIPISYGSFALNDANNKLLAYKSNISVSSGGSNIVNAGSVGLWTLSTNINNIMQPVNV